MHNSLSLESFTQPGGNDTAPKIVIYCQLRSRNGKIPSREQEAYIVFDGYDFESFLSANRHTRHLPDAMLFVMCV